MAFSVLLRLDFFFRYFFSFPLSSFSAKKIGVEIFIPPQCTSPAAVEPLVLVVVVAVRTAVVFLLLELLLLLLLLLLVVVVLLWLLLPLLLFSLFFRRYNLFGGTSY